MVTLNEGFESGPKGLHQVSRIALETTTPEAMPDEGMEGALKRNVLEPDQFPRVGFDKIFPYDPENADIDVAAPYPDQGKVMSHQGKIIGNKPGKNFSLKNDPSATAGRNKNK